MKEDLTEFVAVNRFLKTLVRLDLADYDDLVHWSSYWMHKDPKGFNKYAMKAIGDMTGVNRVFE